MHSRFISSMLHAASPLLCWLSSTTGYQATCRDWLEFRNVTDVPCQTCVHLFMESSIATYLCGLVARDPGYRTEMYCAFCEVRTEFIHVI
jgi:hypothetical protein